jgi:hypothetical protein
MKDKELISALMAINGYLGIDKADGGPQSDLEITNIEAAGMAICNELSKRGYAFRVDQKYMNYMSKPVNRFYPLNTLAIPWNKKGT